MATNFDSFGLGGLGDEEKLELVGQLWDELVASSPPGGLLTCAQREELRRREADAAVKPSDWVACNDAPVHFMDREGIQPD